MLKGSNLVPVTQTSKVLETFLKLDSCSPGTFMDEQFLVELNILGIKTTITVKILNGEATKLTRVVQGFTRKDLAVKSDVVKQNQTAKWKYLLQIKDELNLN